MKSASKIMYVIGRVFNIIALVCAVIGIVIGAIAMSMPAKIADQSNGAIEAAQAHAVGLGIVIGAAISFVVYLVLILLATKASKSLDNGKKDTAPHVLMIIVGIFGDIFYLLGGIFGLIAEDEEN